MRWQLSEARLAIIGLGYVGLPLAIAFAKIYDVVGFDINKTRIKELLSNHDRTREASTEDILHASRLLVTTDVRDLSEANVYLVTTPTPIDEHKNPDMSAVLAATRTVANVMRHGDIVIYESTVYPGATEEECVPLLEKVSGLTFNEDFFVGYSPERINPGDKDHRFESIVKVTSGSTPEVAAFVDDLYGSVVSAGTHMAPSIKVAEAAKVIENVQRDLNIALINELALVFNLLQIDTQAVLAAAGTKWNFLKFQPGLVGGHCIGVDPYYLTHKAQAVGYHPELILAGRRLNDSMGSYVASEMMREMIQTRIDVRKARVLLLGLAFKENTPDLRNTRVVDIYEALGNYGVAVDVHDPWVDPAEAYAEYGITVVETPTRHYYEGIVVAVAHEEFRRLGGAGIHQYGKEDGHIVYDLKAVLPVGASDLRL